jgi:hypothetical protein
MPEYDMQPIEYGERKHHPLSLGGQVDSAFDTHTKLDRPHNVINEQ